MDAEVYRMVELEKMPSIESGDRLLRRECDGDDIATQMKTFTLRLSTARSKTNKQSSLTFLTTL